MFANFRNIKLEIIGESHSQYIGARLLGVPVGTRLDLSCMRDLLARRSSSGKIWQTGRRESDDPVMRGIEKDGDKYIVKSSKIEFYIANNDIKTSDYDNIRHIPRPSHADLAAWAKDGAIAPGGGRFSGRMTAPLCAAGGVAKELLEQRGIFVDAYVLRLAGIELSSAYDAGDIAMRGVGKEKRAELRQMDIPALSDKNSDAVRERLSAIAREGDSVGSVIECVISGLKAGMIGDALFDGIEGKLAYAAYAVPAVKGVEFGKGFELADMRGSASNDEIGLLDGKPSPLENKGGGIAGGISTGLPVIMRVAIKPTPSISKPQKSVDLATMSECSLKIEGRHDVCVALRAIPSIEAAVALAILDMIFAGDDKK